MDAGTSALEELRETMLAELVAKQKHYRSRAWQVPLMWIVVGPVVGLLKGQPIVGLVAGVVIGGLWAVYFLWQASKDPRSAPVLDLLRTRVHDIVWIYTREARHEESAVLILGLADGVRHEVPVVGDRERLEAIMDEVGARLPWVTVGFHHEHERRYFDNPASLRREVSR